MIQCIICEDWFHGTCLKVDKQILDSDDTGELICFQCIQKYEILQYYDITNKCTDRTSETCKKLKEKVEIKPNTGVFLRESFRSDLCQCETCMQILTEKKIVFLTKKGEISILCRKLPNLKGDSMEDYESEGKEILEAERCQTDNQINGLLNQLDYRGQQEIAYG